MLKNNNKLLIAFIATVFALGAFFVSNASAITLNSLNYGINLNPEFDCNFIKRSTVVRDSSWTTEEYYIKVFEDIYSREKTFGDLEASELRGAILQRAKENWEQFTDQVYQDYIIAYIHNPYDEPDFDYDYYLNEYREELADEYYIVALASKIHEIDPVELDFIYSFYNGGNYDIMVDHCSEKAINTTYDFNGYSTFIKLGDNEHRTRTGEYIVNGNTLTYHKDNYADLRITLTQVDATTIKATYTLKNLTNKADSYGLGVYSDIELGPNDYAAVQKDNHSFTITQDDSEYEDSFGAQFHILADPIPSTTYIGDYWDAYLKTWESSNTTSITRADSVDTGLTFSWQGQIGANETKTFTATYTVNVAEGFENSFYHFASDGLNHEDAPGEVITAIDGGALTLPSTNFVANMGYNRKWNTKADGTGTTYESGETIIANKDIKNYYEVEKPNAVKGYITKNDYGAEQNVVVTDELAEALNELAATTYGDIVLDIDIDEIPEEFAKMMAEEYGFDVEKIFSTEGGFETLNLFYIDELRYYWIDEYGYENGVDDIDELYPLTIRVKFSEDDAKKIDELKLIRVDAETGEISEVPITYNKETGEMTFEITKITDYYRVAYTQATIVVPNTGYFTGVVNVLKENSIVVTVILATILATIITVRFRKNAR